MSNEPLTAPAMRIESDKPAVVDIRTCTMTGRTFFIDPSSRTAAMTRFVSGDWGDVPASEKRRNDRNLRRGGELMGWYRGADGERLVTLVAADRSHAVLCVPEDLDFETVVTHGRFGAIICPGTQADAGKLR